MKDVGSDTNNRETIAWEPRKERRLGKSLQRNKCQSWALKDE